MGQHINLQTSEFYYRPVMDLQERFIFEYVRKDNFVSVVRGLIIGKRVTIMLLIDSYVKFIDLHQGRDYHHLKVESKYYQNQSTDSTEKR